VLGKTALTEAVARYLFKLMAYKDEYEVARLHTDTAFLGKVNAMFEGDFKLNYHLAPPLIAPKNDKGELQKKQFGPWMLGRSRCWPASRACAARRWTSSAAPKSGARSAP
jgi:indolepyruvate ferredoxin oxidoreductase